MILCDDVTTDEVESLAAARKAALSGSEPSDSIRVWFCAALDFFVNSFLNAHLYVSIFNSTLHLIQLENVPQVVNALLTQMDKLKSSPNVIILTTSNITAAIGKPIIYFILVPYTESVVFT